MTILMVCEIQNITAKNIDIDRNTQIDKNDSVLADTVKVTDLQNLEVVGRRGWFEPGKAVFIPSKKEKNRANSPETLVESMNIPILKVVDRSIQTLSGIPVTVFINGRKADEIDSQTFWPKNAQKVEFLEHPSDPRYEGVDYAVNFIVTEYSAGGVTKFDGHQMIPNSGNYSASSKVGFKNMTIGVLLSGGFRSDHLKDEWGENQYKDLYYNDTHYNNITESFDSHSWSHNYRLGASMNMTVNFKKWRMTHNIAYKWDRDSRCGSESDDHWSPDLFNSTSSSSKKTGISIAPQASGDYHFQLSDKWTLYAGWSYNYSHNNTSSLFQSLPLNPILNGVKENVNDFSAAINSSFKINDRMNILMAVISNQTWYSTRYSGSSDEKLDQSRGNVRLIARFWWRPIPDVMMSVAPVLRLENCKVGNLKTEYTITPGCNFYADWRMNRNAKLNLSLAYYTSSPDASNSADVMLRSSELLWIAGNPHLRNMREWSSYASFTWMPGDIFSISPSFSWSHEENDISYDYLPADPKLGGLIKRYQNASASDWLSTFVSISLRLFNNSLILSAQPSYRYQMTAKRNLANWNLTNCQLKYNLGNCSFRLYYQGPAKWLDENGAVVAKCSDQMDFGFSWGTGNWYASFTLNDLFNRRRRISKIVDTPYYKSINASKIFGIRVGLTLSYTFDYGKKIDHNIDVRESTGAISGALH